MNDDYHNLLPEELEAVFFALARVSSLAVSVKDKQGRYRLSNEANAKLCGRTLPEVLGKSDADFFSPETVERLSANDERSLQSGQLSWKEETVRQKEHNQVLLTHRCPVRDSRGDMWGLLSLSADITARKTKERRLSFLSRGGDFLETSTQEPEDGLRALARAAVPSFADLCIIDLLDQQGAISRDLVFHSDETFTQKELDAFLRWPPKTGDPFGTMWVLGSKKPQLIEHVTVEMLKATSQSEEHFEYLKSLEIRSLISLPLKIGDKIEGVLSLILYGEQASYTQRDLESATALALKTSLVLENSLLHKTAQTELDQRRAIQGRLVSARDEALQSSRAQENFLARISHEIRTPLTGLAGILELLQSDAEISETLQQRVDMMEECVGSVLEIVNDLLDLSSAKAGKLKLKSASFDLRSVALRSLSLFEANARKSGLQLELEVDENLPNAFLGDAARVGQILNNFVSNAVKYTAKGEVTLALRREDVGFTIEVHDSGPGLSVEHAASLFQPYTRGGTEFEQSVIEGTGLGLSITRELTEQMGGKVGVKSTLGKGACFWAYLPLLQSEMVVPSPLEDPVLEEKLDGHLLVVEDNEIIRRVLLSQLRRLGLQVTGVSNGKDAIKAAQEQRFDLVFMDCQMPVMNGFQASKYLRTKNILPPEIPIIALTGFSRQAKEQRCLDSGMNAFLSKPCSVDDLQQCIRHWIRR